MFSSLKSLMSARRCQAADLSKNGIGVRGTTALVEALKQNETLQTLVLDTNSIGDEGAEILAKHLSSKFMFCKMIFETAFSARDICPCQCQAINLFNRSVAIKGRGLVLS